MNKLLEGPKTVKNIGWMQKNKEDWLDKGTFIQMSWNNMSLYCKTIWNI